MRRGAWGGWKGGGGGGARGRGGRGTVEMRMKTYIITVDETRCLPSPLVVGDKRLPSCSSP